MLDERRSERLLRERTPMRAVDSVHVEIDGGTFVNFASNNYLGLTHHPVILKAAEEAARRGGMGSGAAGLITGYSPAHREAEEAIARWKGVEACVLLPSGYQANHAIVQTLAAAGEAGRGVRFLIDKLAHASLIDAVRATNAPFRVFPHNHMAKLARLLAESETDQLQVVLTESIFSMDGDACDLQALAALKRRHPFILVLDEAHGSGVYGADGGGYAAELGLEREVDVSVVTLSKALGCSGGAVCGTRALCDALINFGRAYIYTTSVPSSLAAAVTAAVTVVRAEPERRTRVRALSRNVRDRLIRMGLSLPEGDSPIVPIVLGSESSALVAANALRDRGLLSLAVRPPTVPKGSSRLRVTLSCDHTDAEVDRLLDALATIEKGG